MPVPAGPELYNRGVTDATLLEHIARLPHARANFKQLVRELGTRGEGRAELETALARLAARGDLIELRSGHYTATARSREFAVGRVNMHRDGYGFLISDRPIDGIQGDIFLPPETAEKAMHGDRVVVRIARIEASGRADGEIVKVLQRAHLTVVGEFRFGKRGQFVVPHDDRIRQWIEIPQGMELPPAGAIIDRIGVTPRQVNSPEELAGLIVNVEMLEYAERGEHPVGRVIEILGRRRTISASMSRSSSASIICRTGFHRKWWSRRKAFRTRFPKLSSPARRDFRGARYRHHRRRNRARFRRRGVGGAAARTATTRCKSTSPT